jgi:hypothetical protein
LVQLTSPPGLSLRSACRWSDLEPGTTAASRRAVRAVYADERDVLVVDQIRGPVEARGLEVALPGLGTGQLQATGGGLVLTVALGPDQALRVRTSLGHDALLAWAAGLRRR